MNKSNIPFLLLWLGLGLASCNDVSQVEVIDQISIQAYLYADEAVENVKIGKVIPLDSNEVSELPSDLNPVIYDESGNAFPLSLSADGITFENQELIVEAGKSYRFELDYKGVTIEAETEVPFPPQNLVLSASSISRTQINDFTDLQDQEMPDPLELEWEGEADAYFFVSVNNVESSPLAINQLFQSGEGPPRFDALTEPSQETYYFLNSFREITHFGSHRIRVYHVNPEYVALYEDNSSGAGSLNEIRTNVINGFGIFTGVSSSSVSFYVNRK